MDGAAHSADAAVKNVLYWSLSVADFSLLQNSFAVLALGPRATREHVAERAQEIATSEASAASRSLITPRTRVETEVGFLPGADEETAKRILDALATGAAPDGWDLTLPARANLYGHLLSAQSPTPTRLREFMVIRSRLGDEDFAAVIADDHQLAGMPPPPAEILRRALESITETHAAVAAQAAAGLGVAQGASLVVELISHTQPDDALRAGFMRRVSSAWTRATSARLAAVEEIAGRHETVLRDKPDATAAAALARIIGEWAELTSPAREIDIIAGLTHQPSSDAAKRWRAITLRLVNEHKAAMTALPVAEVLAEHFSRLPDIGSKLLEDVNACREIAEGERAVNHPAVVALSATIQTARAKADVVGSALDGSLSLSGRGPAVEAVVDAFQTAVRAKLGNLPWLLLRQLTLWLHNEKGHTAAALSLTRLMAATADECDKDGMEPAQLADLRVTLQKDVRALSRELAQKKLQAAVREGRQSEAIAHATEAATLADGDEERRNAEAIRDKLSEQISKRTRSRVLWGLAAAVVIGWILVEENNTPSRPATYYLPPPAQAPYTPPSPPPSSTTGNSSLMLLPKSELRWCEFQSQRLDAAQAFLRTIRNSGTYAAIDIDAAVGQFNTLVDQYNSACVNRDYLERDLQQVQDEARGLGSELVQEGQRLISSVLTARVTPPAPPAPSQGISHGVDALANRAMAREVQERLNMLGFNAGPADGSFGPRSRSALREFKRSRGLPDNDVFDAAALRALSL